MRGVFVYLWGEKVKIMTTIEILLLIIAIAAVSCVVLGFCNTAVTAATAKSADKLGDDVRFQRDVAQRYLLDLRKAQVETALLREKLNGSAYSYYKGLLEEKSKEGGAVSDAVNDILEKMKLWENQNEG